MDRMETEQFRNTEKALIAFSDSLVPSDEFIAEGKHLMQKIFLELQRKSRFPISRTFFGGSIGKSTGIVCPDFDCTIFVNQEEPPFPEVLADFEDILLLNDNLKVLPSSIQKTKYSVCFTLQGGLTVDLLPAANLVQDNKGLHGSDLADIQRQEVFRRLERNPKKFQVYSSSLAESQLQFMKKQDSFAHQLVRLAKFWYKTLYFGEYISGAKTIMELIATAAANLEDGRDEKSILRAFMKFLSSVAKLDTLKIVFQEVDGRWSTMSENDLKSCKRVGNLMRGLQGIPGMEILERSNFIVEPANPLNDLAEGLCSSVVKKFKDFAEITMKRFDNVTRSVVIIHDQPFLPFQNLFKPLPTVLRHMLPPVTNPTYNVGIRLSNALNCDKKIINEDILRKPEIQNFVSGAQVFLFSAVHSYVRAVPNASTIDVMNMMGIVVDDHLEGRDRRKWVPREFREEEFDVILAVPISLQQGNYVARLCIKFN